MASSKKSGKPARKSSTPAKTKINNPSTLQRVSAPILIRLHGMPRWLFPIFTAALLVGGLLIGNAVIAATLLGLLSLILAWLVALSWPILTIVARLMRLLVLGALIFVTISRARGQM